MRDTMATGSPIVRRSHCFFLLFRFPREYNDVLTNLRAIYHRRNGFSWRFFYVASDCTLRSSWPVTRESLLA